MRVEQFWGICARHSDSGSLKMLVGDGANALIVSWRILLKASGRASALWCPPTAAATSRLSLEWEVDVWKLWHLTQPEDV